MRYPAEMRARGRTSRPLPARSLRAFLALVLLVPHLTGCYHYVTVSSTAITERDEVLLGVTDLGRVELAEPVGPGVQRLGGRLMERTDTSFVLSVLSVKYMDLPQPVRWRGERLEIRRDLTSEIQQRRLSRPRTWIMVGLVVAGGVLASRVAIDGIGGAPVETRPKGREPGQQ